MNGMRLAWVRWMELSIRERLILLQALFLLPVAGILLRLFRFQTVSSYLARMTPLRQRAAGAESLPAAKRTAELVNIAAWRGLYEATCLRRSLVLWWMLRWRGIDSNVRIGVRMEGEQFLSHAWVEWQGIVLNDSADVKERHVTFM